MRLCVKKISSVSLELLPAMQLIVLSEIHCPPDASLTRTVARGGTPCWRMHSKHLQPANDNLEMLQCTCRDRDKASHALRAALAVSDWGL